MSKRKKSKKHRQPSRKIKQYRRKKWWDKNGAALLWVGGLLIVLVTLITANSVWQAQSTKAVLGSASRNEGATILLPLATAANPLQGGHDMSQIPHPLPQPQPAPTNKPAPQLDIPNDSHDFGDIPGQPDVAHVFSVQNTGDANLEISSLVTSCGCTTAELSSSVIPPGQRADLTVIFDPDYHTTSGPATRLVWFKTNDVTQPWAELKITANVQP